MFVEKKHLIYAIVAEFLLVALAAAAGAHIAMELTDWCGVL